MLVLEEVGAIANLRAVMPICSGCKNVRDDRGRWLGVERYFRTHLDIHFSHGLCPECAQAFFPKDHHVNDPHEPAAEKTQPDSLQ